jgi:hypothetical protein
LKDETGNAVPFGEMLAAEIRHRAAGDDSFLMPVGRSVKQNRAAQRSLLAGPKP